MKDTLRDRKEVTQYHKATGTADEGHCKYNTILGGFVETLRSAVPPTLVAHEIEDESFRFVLNSFFSNNSGDEDDMGQAKNSNIFSKLHSQLYTIHKGQAMIVNLSQAQSAVMTELSIAAVPVQFQ